ncbi:MAG: beta-lactamase family protein, partial [Proteobacteria bacterium]|nr:beta-lactamase family protein [Pseudomonadota bacterium]
YSGYNLYNLAPIGAGYVAKHLCSGVFVSGRDPEQIKALDLKRGGFVKVAIDRQNKSVTGSVFGLFERRAIYRPGLGCTLVIGRTEAEIRNQPAGDQTPVKPDPDKLWPLGSKVDLQSLPPEVDRQKLRAAVDWAFSEPNPKHLRRTWAVVIVYKGRIIAERYEKPITQDTPLLGQSMTKSVVNALVGILVAQGKLKLDAKALLPEWSPPGDPRRDITLEQMLRMTSGLKWVEDYANPLSDTPYMLYGTGDKAAFALAKPLENKPGAKWYYSTGTTNIICRIIKRAFGNDLAKYLSFPRRALFNPLKMSSAVLEPDASGTFTGSTFMYATARDWARFGLLYLRRGDWFGRKILPASWVDYSIKPTPGMAPKKYGPYFLRYGAHFWLCGQTKCPDPKKCPALPGDCYTLRGYQGQFVTIIPSRHLVIVRMGLTLRRGDWTQGPFVAAVVEAIKP